MAEVVHSYGCNHPNWNGTIVYPYDAVHRSYLRGKNKALVNDFTNALFLISDISDFKINIIYVQSNCLTSAFSNI